MYRLVLLHIDADWAGEVATEVLAVAQRALQRADVIEVCSLADALADKESPTAVVYLASAEACADVGIRNDLEAAQASAFAILPIGREEAGLHRLLPPEIRRLNAVIWSNSDRALKIARLLGFAERERKLFLSYRRLESEQLALQLRHALSDRGYDVFLDRFSVPPAVDFQRRLDTELADKAFVLLLESASAVGSDWVQHEVSYALAHHIAVVALSLPDANPDGRFGVVDDAFRLGVNAADLLGSGVGADRRLTPGALERVLGEVELQAARQLRRRREQLLGAVNDFLFSAGAQRTPVGDWALLAERDGESPAVHLVTPRAPTAFDLQSVDRLRGDTADSWGHRNRSSASCSVGSARWRCGARSGQFPRLRSRATARIASRYGWSERWVSSGSSEKGRIEGWPGSCPVIHAAQASWTSSRMTWSPLASASAA